MWAKKPTGAFFCEGVALLAPPLIRWACLLALANGLVGACGFMFVSYLILMTSPNLLPLSLEVHAAQITG
jgi:hypothetical protein